MTFLATDITAVMDLEAQLIAADGTTPAVLLAPQIAPIALAFPTLANTDVIDHHVQLFLSKGGVDSVIGSITVPAGAGTGGVAPVGLFGNVFNSFATPAALGPGIQLSWRVEEAVTLTNKVTLQLSVASF